MVLEIRTCACTHKQTARQVKIYLLDQIVDLLIQEERPQMSVFYMLLAYCSQYQKA